MTGPETNADLRSDLAQVVVEWDQANGVDLLIGQEVLPPFETEIAESGYPVLRRAAMRKLPADGGRRAPGAGFNRGEFAWGRDSFDCIERAHEMPCDRKQAAKYRRWIDYEAENAMIARLIVLFLYEKAVADTVMNATTFTAHNVGTAWSTTASSTPLADIDTAANTIEDVLGIPRELLTLVLPRSGWQNLRNSTSVLDTLKNWDSGIQRREAIKRKVVAQYLDIADIKIGRATYDSAPKAIAESLSQIWPTQYGMLARLGSAGLPLKTICLGRTIRWTDGMPSFITLESYGEDSRDSEIVRGRQFCDEVIISTDAGYLLDLTKAS